MKKVFFGIFLFFFITTSIITLATAEETNDTNEKNVKTEEEYWNNAMYYYADRSFQSSAEEFEGLSRNYSYSNLTHNSLLMEIYTNYLDDELGKIQGIAEVFYRLFPMDKDTDYVLYMQAMALIMYKPFITYFNGKGYKIIKDEKTMTKQIKEAKQILQMLVKDFPTSKYTEDAKQKIMYLQGLEQLNDVYVGERYQKLGQFVPAMKRYTGMFEIYKDNLHPQIEERILCHIIGLSKTLKLDSETKKYQQKLTEKYPNNKCK